MITLGIETSCDETSVALVKDNKVLSNEISSSVHLHSQYGGVVPEIASRFHTEYIFPVFKKAVKSAHCAIDDIDLIAVTNKPGLPGSLLVGCSFARAISFAKKIPLMEINHLYAHILSCFLINDDIKEIDDIFPFVGVVLSGGHTNIYVCKTINDFVLIGRTKDDAVGEAFDKVAKMLELTYPGGPIVEERAKQFREKKSIKFPQALIEDKKDLDFSFSGIKTAVLYYWKDSQKTEEEKTRICFSFQNAVIDVIDEKIRRALAFTGARSLAVGGGVTSNMKLRERLKTRCQKEKVKLYMPEEEFCGDNAAMVAAYGAILYREGKKI